MTGNNYEPPPDWNFTYWRSVFVEINVSFGWTDAQIWNMTEGEINAKLYELKQRKLNEILNEYLKYGRDGEEQLAALKPFNPVRRLWEKRLAEKEKEELAFDLKMFRKTISLLEKIDGEKKGKEVH